MIAASQADELMVITAVYDHEARKKSYDLLADAFGLGKKRRRNAVIPGAEREPGISKTGSALRAARNDG